MVRREKQQSIQAHLTHRSIHLPHQTKFVSIDRRIREERTLHYRGRRTVRTARSQEDVIERVTQSPPIRICIVVNYMCVSRTSVQQHIYEQQRHSKANHLLSIEHKYF